MKKIKKIKGLHELYEKDPIVADKIVWGRESNAITRRGFLKNSGLLTMSAALGSSIPFSKYFPAGMIPAAYAQTEELFDLYGNCLLYTSPSPRDMRRSRMPSSA